MHPLSLCTTYMPTSFEAGLPLKDGAHLLQAQVHHVARRLLEQGHHAQLQARQAGQQLSQLLKRRPAKAAVAEVQASAGTSLVSPSATLTQQTGSWLRQAERRPDACWLSSAVAGCWGLRGRAGRPLGDCCPHAKILLRLPCITGSDSLYSCLAI